MNLVKTIKIFSVCFILVGCFGKPISIGEETELCIIADPKDWQFLESTLKDVFERFIHTPQPEKVFAVHWVSPANFSEYATRKNLIILGTLNAQGELTQKIENMLSPEVRERVKAGTAFVFPKNDPWANEQLLVVLVSNTLPELREKLMENKEFLYNLFKNKLIEKTTEQMFNQLEQIELEKKLLNKYGWTIRVQHDYIVNIERPQNRFIMLRRSLPGRERWLFVHWIDEGDPKDISEEWAIKTRNRLTTKFYENDKINEEYTHSKQIKFLGRPAVMLEGLWENDEKVAGGPFRNYSFYDIASQRIYMIDIAVFFPGGDKEPYLRQMDIMAHSFKTAEEIPEADLGGK
ncbi:MAG: DUF4837 family protein [bacterium]